MTQIYVDKLSSSLTEDGTPQNPWKTIPKAIDAAKPTDTVRVKGNIGNPYVGSVILKKGVNLEPWSGIPRIEGFLDAPIILAKGDNTIRGFTLVKGRPGIKIDLEDALRDIDKTTSSIIDCEIIESDKGIQITSPMDTDYLKGKRKSAYIFLYHNWINHTISIGIESDLRGPKNGELQISLRIEDNIIQKTCTTGASGGITLRAEGHGPNPKNFVRALHTGWIFNNLIFDGNASGISLQSKNFSSSAIIIVNNTIDNNSQSGISASATDSSTHPDVINNIISNNQVGYFADDKCQALELSNNLFFQNQVHYSTPNFDLTNQIQLNTPIINNKLMFISCSGNPSNPSNLVSDPLFVDGFFPWMGSQKTNGPHQFFLSQNKSQVSPAVDSGKFKSIEIGLHNHTTRLDFTFDIGKVDRGFHYQSIES